MHRPGDQFLARAAFAQQQNRRARRRHLLDHLENFLHRRRFADDVFQAELGVQLLAQRNVFRFQILLPQRARNPHFQFVNLQPAFGDVIVRAAFHRVHRQFLRAVGRHQNADRRLGQRFGPRNQFHAVLVRQPEIREQHVEIFALPADSIAAFASSAI